MTKRFYKGQKFKTNADHRFGTFRGHKYLIVPVVMLMETVVNGAFVPARELKAEGWNGVPVTLNHPEDQSGFITANAPMTLEKFQVGTIFNARIDGNKLKAEAWINIEMARAIDPGLVDRLKSGEPMDVSVGYFSTWTEKSGSFKGKPYTEVHTDLKPDHLALLPEDEGACSWADGCGVRANQRSLTMATTKKTMAMIRAKVQANRAKIKTNERGDDDSHMQTVADLISDDRSPFTDADMWSLVEMTDEALSKLRETYLPAAEEEADPEDEEDDPAAAEDDDNAEEDDDPEAMEEGDEDEDDDEKPKANASKKQKPKAASSKKISDMTACELTQLITETATASAVRAVETAMSKAHKTELVTRLAANKDLGLTAKDLSSMPIKVLEKMASASKVEKSTDTTVPGKNAPNFAGRVLRTKPDQGSGAGEEAFAAMANHGVVKQTAKQ